MGQIGRMAWVLGLIAIVPSLTRSDDAPQVEAVDRVLRTWQEHSSQLTSLKVAYWATHYDRNFGNTESAGWLWMAKPNLALVDMFELDGERKPTNWMNRLVWAGKSTYIFQIASRSVMKVNLFHERENPPRFLSLYFLFSLTVDEAKKDHDWAIRSENHSEIVLRASMKKHQKKSFDQDICSFFDETWITQPSTNSFEVTLDKQTFLPKKIYLLPDSSLSDQGTTYRVSSIETNLDFDLGSFKNPSVRDWKLQAVDQGLPRKTLEVIGGAIRKTMCSRRLVP